MQKEAGSIFTMRYIENYKSSLNKRMAVRRVCSLMYPVLLAILCCWPERFSENLMIPFTVIFAALVLLFWERTEAAAYDVILVATGEKNTTFYFIGEGKVYLEYVFANDYTSARKMAAFNPFHVEVEIRGKGRQGIIREGEVMSPDDISLEVENRDDARFQYSMGTVLRFFVPVREFRKAEQRVPFLMGLSKQL